MFSLKIKITFNFKVIMTFFLQNKKLSFNKDNCVCPLATELCKQHDQISQCFCSYKERQKSARL